MNKIKNSNKEQVKHTEKRKFFLNDNSALDTNFIINKKLPKIQKKIGLKELNTNSESNFPLILSNKSNSYKSNKLIFNSINKMTDISERNKIFSIESSEKKTPIKLNKSNKLVLNNQYKVQLTENYSDKQNQKKIDNKNDEINNRKMSLDNIINMKNVAKSTKSIFPKKNLFLTDEGKKYKYNVNKFPNKNKSFKKTKTNIENKYNNSLDNNITSENLAYSNRYVNFVFNHLKQINDYKYQKYLQLNPSEDSHYKFIHKNRQITRSNILLRLMKMEQNKLETNYNLHSDRIKNNEKKLEKDKKIFEELKEKQKMLGKKYESMFSNINLKYRELLNGAFEGNYIIKNNQDEIRRILHKIDKLRVYGYFINEVLGGDVTRFEKQIIPEDKYEEDINYPQILKEVIKKYNYLLKDSLFYDDKISFDEAVLEHEKSFMDEPEKMWFKFKEIENIIVRNVFIKEKIKNDIKQMIEEKNYNLKDLKQKKELLENEYKNLKENYDYEKSKYNGVEKRYISHKIEINETVNDLFDYSQKSFNHLNLTDKNFESYDILETTKEIHRIIQNCEIYLDGLILNLKKFEKEDSKLFEKIIDNRKKYLKFVKTQNILNQKMKEKFNFILDVNSLNKIVFKSRKTEAPYHKPKKVEKVEIDQNLIERLENEEMLTYEKEDYE